MYRYLTLSCFLFASLTLFGQQPPLIIDLSSDSSYEVGEEFDLEVRIRDFQDIFSLQLFILWDSTVVAVQDVSYTNPDLSGFNDEFITLPFEDVDDPRNNKLRFAWTSTNPFSLPDDTHIMSVRYAVIGEPCDTVSFNIGDIGIDQNEKIEVADINFENIGAISDGHGIQIPGPDCLSSSAELFVQTTIRNYPNPTAGELHVDIDGLENPQPLLYELYNDKGQLIISRKLNSKTNVFDLKSLPEASYPYRISSGNLLIDEGHIMKIK